MASAALTKIDGREVLATSIAIRRAGDGLSKAMNVDPVELHLGQKVYVVVECEVAGLKVDPIKDTKGVNRTHVLRAGVATMVEQALVRDVLDEQQRRIEEAEGVHRLPFDDSGVAFDEVAMNPRKAKVPALREWLSDHDLDATGTKPDLVKRVEDWWLARKAENEKAAKGAAKKAAD